MIQGVGAQGWRDGSDLPTTFSNRDVSRKGTGIPKKKKITARIRFWELRGTFFSAARPGQEILRWNGSEGGKRKGEGANIHIIVENKRKKSGRKIWTLGVGVGWEWVVAMTEGRGVIKG